MHAFPGLTLTEAEGLPGSKKAALLFHARRLRAMDALDRMKAANPSMQFVTDTIQAAFAGDPEGQAAALESATRKE